MTRLPDHADDWRDLAACRNEDPETFFAEGKRSRAQVFKAQAICHACPVRQQCGKFAIKTGQSWGVWGGMSQSQLRKRRNRFTNNAKTTTRAVEAPSKKREPAKCGTRAGYQKHLREKTEICAPCRQANTDADNRLRRTGTTKAAA
jgi:hypothetical protein